MSEEERKSIEGVHLEGRVTAGVSGDSSVVVAGHEIEIEDAAHRRRVEQQQLDHDLDQAKRDNDIRRRKDWWLFCLVLVVLTGFLVVGSYLMLLGRDAEARNRGQALVFLIIGAVGGYVTGAKISPS